jgi:hypothetical protein
MGTKGMLTQADSRGCYHSFEWISQWVKAARLKITVAIKRPKLPPPEAAGTFL